MKQLRMHLLGLTFVFLYCSLVFGQSGEAPVKVFGYFQNILSHQKENQNVKTANSFSLQQLNLFLQKDLAKNWTTFVDFEFTNTYSSFKSWGAFELAEAWVRYRSSKQFNIRLGLQIPTFNNLNEIKNRTPLLPYITRPLVYETSFNEFLDLEGFLPDRAFLQTFGYIPQDDFKFDYAVFLGNSPNINSSRNYGQTGLDTSSVMLVGGRVGFRWQTLKAGISGTWDKVNFGLSEQQALIFNKTRDDFERVPRRRIGTDLSFFYKNVSLESEYIKVDYDHDVVKFQANKEFFYFTLGYQISERLFVYGSYWKSQENGSSVLTDQQTGKEKIVNAKITVTGPNAGAAYNFSDRIFIKVQVADGDITSTDKEIFEDNEFLYFQTAVSVVF